MLGSSAIPGIDRAFPICTPGASDTARFDEALELLHLGGRPLHHAILMMIPEAWENNAEMDPAQRAFYRFHSTVMEPWDGPASVTFTDGTVIGAVLDRNGLRPSRYWVTDDDMVVMASEVGVIDIDPAKVVTKGRVQPGRHVPHRHRPGPHLDDEEIKTALAAEHPYADGRRRPRRARRPARPRARRVQPRQRAAPPATVRLQPRGAQGHPRPDGRPRLRAARLDVHGHPDRRAVRPAALLFDYFAQLFAQVTNPPLDAIREEVVTSVSSTIGPEADLLSPGPESCRQLVLPFPIIDNERARPHRPRQRRRRLPGPACPRRQGPLRRRRRPRPRAFAGGDLQ